MNPTRKQKLYWNRLAELGCCVCRYHCGNPNNTHISIHHIIVNGKKDHDNVLPLCAEHHQTGGEGVAIHPFKRKWELLYGTQAQLKEAYDKLLEDI